MIKKTGILCAGESELAPFLPHIQNCTHTERAMLTVYEGTIGSTPVAAVACGMCKVNAALATQLLIDRYGVAQMINAGAAGGMDPRLGILDTAITSQTAYHDVAEEILTQSHPQLPTVWFQADAAMVSLARQAAERLGCQAWVGRTVTGEAFITDAGRAEINAAFCPLTVDMETAATAHVCYVNRIPFAAIRTVTDTADHSGVEHFEENCARASEIARDITLAMLRELERI